MQQHSAAERMGSFPNQNKDFYQALCDSCVKPGCSAAEAFCLVNRSAAQHSQSPSVMFSSAVMYLAAVYSMHPSVGSYERCTLLYYALNDLAGQCVSYSTLSP